MSEDRIGIDALRDAVETVATEIESRRTPARSSRPRPAWLAAAAALVLVALGWWILRPVRSPEVEVVGMKIRGQAVPTRIVEGAAPGTILVMPDPRPREAVIATAVPLGRGR